MVEPTAVALLAIRNEPGAEKTFERGVSWLLSCQNADGGWGINEDDPESGWQTAWALMAMRYSAQNSVAISRAVEWLTYVGTSQITGEEFKKPEKPMSDDPGAMIWPWLPGEVGWIEPTALSLLALAGINLSALTSTRITAARAYFRKYRTPSGGWDVGNAGPLDTIILPRAHPTALVLMALTRIAPDEIQTKDTEALRLDMQRDPSVLSLSCGLLAIRTLGESDDALHSHIKESQFPNGSWNDNPFFTGWAMMALRGYM